MVVDWISTIYHWLTGWIHVIYSQLIDMFFLNQPHPTIQRPEASQGDCVSAEIDAWAFAGRWESVVCMKAWTLQAYKTANPTIKKSGGSCCFSLKVRHFVFLATWGLSTSEVDLLKGQGVAPPEIPGFFQRFTFHAKGSAANLDKSLKLVLQHHVTHHLSLKYHQSMLTHHTLTFPRFLKAAYNYNCMLQVLPMTPLLACWLPVGEGKVLEERFVELQSSVALWWEVMGESCRKKVIPGKGSRKMMEDGQMKHTCFSCLRLTRWRLEQVFLMFGLSGMKISCGEEVLCLWALGRRWWHRRWCNSVIPVHGWHKMTTFMTGRVNPSPTSWAWNYRAWYPAAAGSAAKRERPVSPSNSNCQGTLKTKLEWKGE